METFERGDHVTADVGGLDMTVTVTEDGSVAGVNTLSGSPITTYIGIDYDEDIQRTVRIYIPDDYVEPRVKEGVESAHGTTTASYEPVAGGDYMAVTVRLSGGDEVALPVNTVFGTYLRTSDMMYGQIENVTGTHIPRLGSSGSAQWQYVPEHALNASNATYTLQQPSENETVGIDDMTVQYDDSPGANDPTWLSVPPCDKTTVPVCATTSDGKAILFSADEEAPPIRYKHTVDHVSETRSAWKELEEEWGQLIDRIRGWSG